MIRLLACVLLLLPLFSQTTVVLPKNTNNTIQSVERLQLENEYLKAQLYELQLSSQLRLNAYIIAESQVCSSPELNKAKAASANAKQKLDNLKP